MIPEVCDICDRPFFDPEDIHEDDGLYRCTPCNERSIQLRSQHPELF